MKKHRLTKALVTTTITTSLFLLTAMHNFASAEINAAWSLKGFEQPESALLNPKSNELLVSNINGGPMELNGKGYISRVSIDGKMLDQRWATGFDAPKGMAYFQGSIFIADMQQLHQVDSKSGQIIKSYFADQSKMLNDVAVDKAGNVYVSDLIAGGIYQLNQGQLSKWYESDLISHPNGLLIKDNELYIGNWGTNLQADFTTEVLGKVYKLALEGTGNQLQALSQPFGNLDGVVAFKDSLIVNDWINGNVFSVKNNTAKLLFNAGKGAADISLFSNKSNTPFLVVPKMFDGSLDVYQLD